MLVLASVVVLPGWGNAQPVGAGAVIVGGGVVLM